jgi:hypothetical protein
MTLREKQSTFILNVARLIVNAFENGIELTFGEALRTPEQQLLYFEGFTIQKIGSNLHFVKTDRKTKTLKSKHLEKLAIDLNIFIDGVWKTDKESYRPIAEYWKSLHPSNDCGYFWNWDFNHFEMK